jgi:4-diphosphocytidyl-2-C-methyl-D-erythritol kinase
MYHRNRVVVEAPAKINLFLEITGRMENGYHRLDSIMQAIDLADVVVIGKTEGDSGLRVTCSRGDVPEDRGNLAYRAAECFFDATKNTEYNIHIYIDKLIPSEAGMGGGSSDAAAVLVGLNELFEAGLPPERLCELGATIGADVPFLIQGGCARAEGIGEVLTPLSPGLRPCWLAVAKPSRGVSTVAAYAAYDRQENPAYQSSQGIRASITEGDLAYTAGRLYNVFDWLAPLPDTEPIKAVMGEHGALGAALTGSGSAVYGIFTEQEAAEACCAVLSARGHSTYLARPVEYGARIVYRS